MALSIALLPTLLYLFRIWDFPPSAHHSIAFGLSTIAGFIYLVKNWRVVQFVLAEDHCSCKETVLYRDIDAMKPKAAEITLVIKAADGHDIVNFDMRWASRSDFKYIVRQLAMRLSEGRA